MKALVLTEYNKFEYIDWEDPTPGEDEVLIRVAACSICGSDVHGMDGSSGRRVPPIIMGHEASGVIESCGAKVSGWKIGDRVTFDSTVYCGRCFYCRRGEINLCDNRMVLGVSPGEYRRHGAFAELVSVPAHILYRLPEGMDFVQAAMAEPVAIAVHAVERTPVALNDTAVVVGAGMIGLLVIQALKAAGCGTVIAVDLEKDRLTVAEELGADATITAGGRDAESIAGDVTAMTGGRGADLSFEVVGATPTLATAIAVVRKGGSVTLVGNLAPETRFAHQAAVTRELTLYGSCGSMGEYPACLEMIADGRIRVDPIISATAPLSEGADWFTRLYGKEPGLLKVVLKPEA